MAYTKTRMIDSKYFTVGNADDGKFYHDGSHTYITNDTGNFYIKNLSHGNNVIIISENASGTPITLIDGDPDALANGRVSFCQSNIYMAASTVSYLVSSLSTFNILNVSHGSNMVLACEDTGGTQRNLIILNPNNTAVEIGYFLTLTDGSELTISGGVVTATKSFHVIDTESDDATDDLNTINGYALGKILTLSAAHTDRTVVVKDGTGNLALAGDMSLDNTEDTITLRGTATGWVELARSNNGA